ncbi:CHRD domain-containing protein [Iamia majanohamensis]|uniref:CHRD domain-containing protein n=1 Tax=Iamia majanohamensis TaxID=467976 RepID=A0AAF0BUT2_9ACTN|nr:CHRD domain-containing protein [Iamia majanohamensis]WCO65739.1 CHRD domain-containing protein [Iamia majanohamensis]
MKRRLPLLAALGLAGSLALPMTAGAQESPEVFQADLQELNGSGATGTATLTLDGDQLTVEIQSQGLAPGLPHAQHIHGDLPEMELVSECPTVADDGDGDGLVSVVEGQPRYGMIKSSITTEGDTGPDSGLAVERFPTAGDDGSVSYSRTYTVGPDVSDDLGEYAVVQHGVDLDGSGMYDGDAPSSLDPELPLEATIPANCGTLAAMPGGGVDTGAGGTAASEGTSGSDVLPLGLMAGGGAAALAGALWLGRRRPAEVTEQ